MLRRSATGIASGSTTSSLATGTDSPVSADSFTRSSASRISRRSAGTLSPASSSTRSPGTSSSDGTVRSWPSRTTLAWVRTIDRKPSSAASALDSWTNPTIALISTTPKITAESTYSPSPAVIAPAASST